MFRRITATKYTEFKNIFTWTLIISKLNIFLQFTITVYNTAINMVFGHTKDFCFYKFMLTAQIFGIGSRIFLKCWS